MQSHRGVAELTTVPFRPPSTEIRSLNGKPLLSHFSHFSHFSLLSLCSLSSLCSLLQQPSKAWNSTPQSRPLTFPHLGTSPSPSSCSTPRPRSKTSGSGPHATLRARRGLSKTRRGSGTILRPSSGACTDSRMPLRVRGASGTVMLVSRVTACCLGPGCPGCPAG